MELAVLLKLVGIFSALIMLARIMGKIGSASGRLLTWLLYGILGLLIIWGIYNQVGKQFGLWEPISFDTYLQRLLSHVPFLDRLAG